MLFTETVEPRTFTLLKRLLEITALQPFSLVDGTALSLLYGHRKSVDLDLFATKSFVNPEITQVLKNEFGDGFVMEQKPPHFGIFCYLDEVKVDFVSHPHPLIRKPKEIDGIRMFSAEDIIAMKVQAVFQRGRKKDFYDISELLMHFPVQAFIKFHKEKYATQNLLITVPKAITYFADAEEDLDPIGLKGQTWNEVKESISSKVREYLG